MVVVIYACMYVLHERQDTRLNTTQGHSRQDKTRQDKLRHDNTRDNAKTTQDKMRNEKEVKRHMMEYSQNVDL